MIFAGILPQRFQNTDRVKETNVYFNIPIELPDDASTHLHVSSAKLKIFKVVIPPEGARETLPPVSARVSVYQILDPGRQDAKLLIDSCAVHLDASAWQMFDVRVAVEHWLKSNATNYGLQLVCEDLAACAWLYLVPGGARYHSILLRWLVQEFWPTLNIFTYKSIDSSPKRKHRKSRRSELSNGDCMTSGDLCCRNRLYVSFKDIGWDEWIFEPAGYDAYYCNGGCPQHHGMLFNPANTHAVIQSVLRQKDRSIPKPCCVPKQLSHLVMVHLDSSSKLVISSLSDMVVDECACT